MLPEFEQKLQEVRQRDQRYSRNAYIFAFHSLDFTLRERMNLTPDALADMSDEDRHITAKQLLEGMRDFAVSQYGYLARHVWESWGVYSTSDWGSVIYNLIEAELMRASDRDKIEDFTGVFDFKQTFDDAWTWN